MDAVLSYRRIGKGLEKCTQLYGVKNVNDDAEICMDLSIPVAQWDRARLLRAYIPCVRMQLVLQRGFWNSMGRYLPQATLLIVDSVTTFLNLELTNTFNTVMNSHRQPNTGGS